MKLHGEVAVVGMACIFPQAPDLRAYWENILAKVDAIGEAPEEWGADGLYDPDAQSNDRIYTKRGGFIGGLARFNPLEYGVMPKEVDGGEPEHFLALRVAHEALRDAGYLERPFPRERTQIVLGRGTYVNRGYISMLQHCLVIDQTVRLLARLHPEHTAEELRQIKAELKSGLPPFNAETAPSLAHSVMCGRIANRLDLRGPAFTVDAACASSLIAIDLGMKELLNGGSDMVLAGGVQVSTTFPISQLFCQLGALSRTGRLKPFHAEADGTLLGEGVGLVVLKRLADAERDGDRIYAVVKGVGIASDGRALGVLAPRIEGEELAMRRAYESAGIAPASIGLVEAHGTGTTVGDATEIDAMRRVFGSRTGEFPRCALGSVKSMIGHCIPAAGIAGFIKVALALHHKVIPPTLHCDSPNTRLDQTPFYLNSETRPWVHGAPEPRRAAVSAFGFGGINAHAILEEPAQEAPASLHGRWDSETVILAAESRRALLQEIGQLRRALTGNPAFALNELAYAFNCSIAPGGGERLGVVAGSLSELDRKLAFAEERLQKPETARIRERSGIYYFQSPIGSEGRLAFLFPGEGAQYPNMLADLCLHFPQCRDWFDLIDRAFHDHARGFAPSQFIFPPADSDTERRERVSRRLWDMDIAIESVFTANQALCSLLLDLGLKPSAVAGHSTGEYSALLAGGAVRVESRAHLMRNILDGNRITEQSIQTGAVPERVLLAVGPAHPDRLRELLQTAGGSLYLSMDNCPHQAVLCGTDEGIAGVQRQLQAEGVICQPLPFRRAYHTPLFAPVCAELQRFFERLEFVPPAIPIYSCATAAVFPDDPVEARRVAVDQWSRPVRFRETIEAMYRDGVRTFIEAGPRGNLTAFVEDILGERKYLAVAANVMRRSGLTQLNHLVAILAAHGIPLHLETLYRRRARKLDAQLILQKAGAPHLEKSMRLSLALPALEISEAFAASLKTRQIAPPTAPLDSSAWDGSSQPVPEMPFPGGLDFQRSEAPVDSGVMREYLSTMERFLESQQQVLQCYFEEPAAETVPAQPAASYPFVGRIEKHVAGQEVVVLRGLDLERDVFLRHHALGPRLSESDPGLLPLPVVPLAISVEMIAEAAALLFPGLPIREVRDFRAFRWIALKTSRMPLAICGRLSAAGGEVNVQIREADADSPEQTGSVLAEAAVDFGEPGSRPAAEPLLLYAERPFTWKPGELYGEGRRHGMFHGPAFQGVVSMDRVGQNGAEATLRGTAGAPLFPDGTPANILTMPLLLDAAGQVLGFWAAERLQRSFIVFPAGFETLRLYAPTADPDIAVCRMELTGVSERAVRANLSVFDRAGRMLLQVLGWEAKRFDLPEEYYAFRLAPAKAFASVPWPKPVRSVPHPERFECCRLEFPPGFLEADGGIWRECLAHLALNKRERETWRTLGKSEQRRTEWLLGRVVAKDAIRRLLGRLYGIAVYPADIDLSGGDDGRPVVHLSSAGAVRSVPVVSIAHSDNAAVAIATDEDSCLGVGIDLERDTAKDAGFETAAFTEEERTLLASCDPGIRNQWLIRLWCAKEAAAKALGKGLVDGPGTVLAKHLDVQTGAVKLRLSGASKDHFPGLKETLVTARTEQDSSFIFATATRERN